MGHELVWGIMVVAAVGAAACGSRERAGAGTVDAPLNARALSIDEAARSLQPRSRDAAYRPGTVEERAIVADVVEALWRGDVSGARAALGTGDGGFVIEAWRVEGRDFSVLRERDDRLRGAGSYAVRTGAAGPRSILLQAPHAYFDRRTGAIAAQIFFAPDARAIDGLFVNSMHRYQTSPGKRERRRSNPSDVCHNPDHLFSVATRASLSSVTRLVQLHGFGATELAAGPPAGPAGGSADDSSEAVALEFDAIVSAGDDRSSAASTAVALAMARGLSVRVGRYPEDTDQLGATTNVQGRICRDAGIEFVHVELSAALRDRLVDSATSRSALGAALAASSDGDESAP